MELILKIILSISILIFIMYCSFFSSIYNTKTEVLLGKILEIMLLGCMVATLLCMVIFFLF